MLMNAVAQELPRSVETQPVIEGEQSVFQEKFNRMSFQFSHYLADHPLFDLPRLIEVAKGMTRPDVYFDAGEVRVNQRWNEVPATELTPDQLIERIENAGAWILLKRANRDPRYAAILNQGLSDAAKLVGAAYPTRTFRHSAVILVTSPNRVTSYHIDPDCNFLCQIRGEKVIHIFDRYDREILPEQELERFWAVDNNAAIYKEQFQNRARSYELKPGVGVHIPVNAPHWVKNANNISVTLAMIFQFPESVLANKYRWNYYLRKFGLTPTPPGHSRIRDALKTWTMSSAIGIRDVVRRLRGRKQ
jgi:hypothetical protein